MSAYINGIHKRSLALSVSLVVLCGLSALPGCSDQLLPVEPGTQNQTAGKIVFTEINNMMAWDQGSVFKRIDAEGNGEISLGDGVVLTAPGSTAAALMKTDGIWLVPVTGATPGAPQLVVANTQSNPGMIDPYSVVATPNGTRLTYTTYEERTTIIAGPGGSAPVTLPRGVARETTPSFSHDGLRLAFFSHDDVEQSSGPAALYVIDVDGTDLIRVATVERTSVDGYASIEWSPSGDRLVYYGRGNESFVIASNGSGEAATIPGIAPVWNIAGDSILYTGGSPGQPFADLYMMAATGAGTARQITTTSSTSELFARFSPDGKQIVYTTYAGEIDVVPGHLTVKDMATGTTKVLSQKAHKGFWIPS